MDAANDWLSKLGPVIIIAFGCDEGVLTNNEDVFDDVEVTVEFIKLELFVFLNKTDSVTVFSKFSFILWPSPSVFLSFNFDSFVSIEWFSFFESSFSTRSYFVHVISVLFIWDILFLNSCKLIFDSLVFIFSIWLSFAVSFCWMQLDSSTLVSTILSNDFNKLILFSVFSFFIFSCWLLFFNSVFSWLVFSLIFIEVDVFDEIDNTV